MRVVDSGIGKLLDVGDWATPRGFPVITLKDINVELARLETELAETHQMLEWCVRNGVTVLDGKLEHFRDRDRIRTEFFRDGEDHLATIKRLMEDKDV